MCVSIPSFQMVLMALILHDFVTQILIDWSKAGSLGQAQAESLNTVSLTPKVRKYRTNKLKPAIYPYGEKAGLK